MLLQVAVLATAGRTGICLECLSSPGALRSVVVGWCCKSEVELKLGELELGKVGLELG